MDDYDNVYKTICRICLSQNNAEKMVSLIDNSTENGLSCFGKAITIVTSVYLAKDDKLPNMMCQKCIYLLKHAIYFKLKCESTNKKLQQLINSNVNKKVSDQHIKETICDYVMFSQYFPLETHSQASESVKHNNRQSLDNLEHRNNQNVQVENIEKSAEKCDDIFDFDDFVDNEENTGSFTNKPEKYSDDINSILNSIQDIINVSENVTTFKKLKRRRQIHYRPTISKLPAPGNNERNINCSICHKTLANRATYNHHMQRHNNCRFICEQCGKGFPLLGELHMHQIAKHGVGPYLKCDHCPFKAPRKLDLIEHLRIHTGERPFTCEKCGLTFRRRAIWRNHLLLHMERTHQCTYCPKKFYREPHLLAHCNNIHERMYMFICSVCSVTYMKPQTVRRHMIVKHGIPREKQGRITKVTTGGGKFPKKTDQK